jgi:hypothetical protein
MKKFLFVFLLVSHQVMAEYGPPPTSLLREGRNNSSEDLRLQPRSSGFLDTLNWPVFQCQSESNAESIRVQFRWNPTKELISLHFIHRSQALEEPEGAQSQVEWELNDMTTDSSAQDHWQDYFEVRYEEPNIKNCDYKLKFMKTIPGLLRQKLFVEMDCDGVQSALTLSCRAR